MRMPLEHGAAANALPPLLPPALQPALAPHLQAFALPPCEGLPQPGDGIIACELPQPGCLWLRGHADDAEFRRRAEAVLGQPLPLQPRGLCVFGGGGGAGVALRMSADEWLLVCRPSLREPLLRGLREALLDVFAQVVDTSAGMATLRLAGPRCLALLQRLGCGEFAGLAAGGVMSRASVIVLRTDADGVLLVFRRSLARHVWRLIERSAEPYGVCIVAPAQHADVLFTPLTKPLIGAA